LHLAQEYDRIRLEATVNSSDDESSASSTPRAEGLVEQGIITSRALEFLKACLVARLNVAISGPSKAGKRKLLQALVSLVPDDEQILAIQNPDEPSLTGKGITSLRANLSPSQGKHIITRQYLLTLVPKIRPQRLVFDRVQGSEALPLLKLLFAMDGVVFSIVADSPEDALLDLERVILLSEVRLDSNTMRRILSSSLDLIIQLRRLQDGSARVVNLTEVSEAKDDAIVLRDIFLCQEVEEDEAEPVGLLRPTGIKPDFVDRMQMLGISLPAEMFHLAP
jgi:pilus assembly protein CpaF